MDNYDVSECVDCQTFLGLSHFDLDQSPVRRYRPIVPALAGAVNFAFGRFFNAMKPKTFPGDFSLGMSFYIVNWFFVSLWGLVIYRFCRAWNVAALPALGGLLVMLTCRWTPYIAGTPIADSVYCLAVGLSLLGVALKSERVLVAAILLGPFAKEAFIFMIPVIFFFGGVSKLRLAAWFALSGILVFSFRYLYDLKAGLPPASGIAADMDHFNYLAENTRRLFSFHGLYDVFSNFGLWLAAPLLAWWLAPAGRREVTSVARPYVLCFLAVIALHMVLSSSYERMFYLSMPVICLLVARSFSVLGETFGRIRK